MTDRDTFAAAALTGLLARVGDDLVPPDRLTECAFAWADAMLAARGDKTPAPPAAGPTLTDAERVAVEASRGFCEARREYWIADMLSHLLARAAKEGGR